MEKEERGSRVGINLVRIAVLYLIGGLGLGIAMGTANDFRLSSVHAHVLLLGWVTMVITGLVYMQVPACQKSRLAKIHAWGHNIALPVLTVGLVQFMLGDPRGQRLVVPGSLLVFAALPVFAVNLFLNSRERGLSSGERTGELVERRRASLVAASQFVSRCRLHSKLETRNWFSFPRLRPRP